MYKSLSISFFLLLLTGCSELSRCINENIEQTPRNEVWIVEQDWDYMRCVQESIEPFWEIDKEGKKQLNIPDDLTPYQDCKDIHTKTAVKKWKENARDKAKRYCNRQGIY